MRGGKRLGRELWRKVDIAREMGRAHQRGTPSACAAAAWLMSTGRCCGCCYLVRLLPGSRTGCCFRRVLVARAWRVFPAGDVARVVDVIPASLITAFSHSGLRTSRPSVRSFRPSRFAASAGIAWESLASAMQPPRIMAILAFAILANALPICHSICHSGTTLAATFCRTCIFSSCKEALGTVHGRVIKAPKSVHFGYAILSRWPVIVTFGAFSLLISTRNCLG